MCITIFEKVKHRLQGWHPSQCVLHMANGTLVKSQATWTGMMELSRIKVQGTLEVFDSGGGWSFLLGKPMLRAFKASHEYENDTIMVRNNHQTASLTNQIDMPYYTRHVTDCAPYQSNRSYADLRRLLRQIVRGKIPLT